MAPQVPARQRVPRAIRHDAVEVVRRMRLRPLPLAVGGAAACDHAARRAWARLDGAAAEGGVVARGIVEMGALPDWAAPWPEGRTDPPQVWREFGTGHPMCSWCGARRRTHTFELHARASCPLCPIRAMAERAQRRRRAT